MWGSVRPRCCLRLGAREAVWAEWGSRWSRRRDTCLLRELPAGLIRPSPIEPNISDPDALETHLRALLKSRPGRWAGRRAIDMLVPEPVVLVLPDLCARAAIIRVESLPRQPHEREALIRWRMGQERLFPVAGTRIAFHPLKRIGRRATKSQAVLAVAIKETVLQQYEAVCEKLGIFTIEVDLASFRLFNLWARATGWARQSAPDDVVWVNLLDGGLTVLIFHAGRPVHIRNKPSAASIAPGDVPGSAIDQLVDEVLASLGICAGSHANLEIKRMIVVSHEPVPALVRRMQDEAAVEVEELSWDLLRGAGWRSAVHGDGLQQIPAVAGLLGG